MSSRTQRILCRAGFLTFCLLPTLAFGGWIVNERVIQGAASPVAEAQARPLAEAELSRRLGLAVTLERIAFPQSGFTVLEGVTVADPETGRRIAFVPSLEMAVAEGGLMLLTTRPEIDAQRWSELWETLHDRVLRERGEKIAPTHLTARQVTLVSHVDESLRDSEKSESRSDSSTWGRSLTFTDVDVRLAPGKAAIDFRLAGVEMPNPAQFKATRDREAPSPVTRWELHTGEAALPCALFTQFVPWLAHFGDHCQFNGSLWAEEAAEGWRGELSGRFTGIDLDRLVSEQFPQKLSGQATVILNRAEFTGGRIRNAVGFLEAGPGTIGRGLLGAAVDAFGLRYTEQLPEAVTPLSRYGQLAFGFKIDEDGLQITGKCDHEGALLVLENPPGAEIHRDARVLDRRTQVTPIVALVHVLAPESEVQVPATQETEALLRVFPLPPVKRPDPPPDLAPEAHVRSTSGPR